MTREELHISFISHAKETGISLDHVDDFLSQYETWADGYNSALRDFGIWNDETQTIGYTDQDINELMISAKAGKVVSNVNN